MVCRGVVINVSNTLVHEHGVKVISEHAHATHKLFHQCICTVLFYILYILILYDDMGKKSTRFDTYPLTWHSIQFLLDVTQSIFSV
jgi:hypothetical protein